MTTLMILLGTVVLLAVLYLARVWWMELHPLYPVWPDDDPQTAFRDHNDYLGIGS